MVLSKGLYDIVQERKLKGSITNVLTEELSHLPASNLEEVVYRKLKDKISLTIRHMDLDLYDRFGTLYYEWILLEDMNSEQEEAIRAIRSLLRLEFKDSGYFLIDDVFTIRDGVYHILLELVGPKLYSPDELDQLRIKLSELTKDQVEIYVRSRPEVVLTKNGYTTFNELQENFLEQAESLYKMELNNLIEGTL